MIVHVDTTAGVSLITLKHEWGRERRYISLLFDVNSKI
jgi:hypothetical protein